MDTSKLNVKIKNQFRDTVSKIWFQVDLDFKMNLRETIVNKCENFSDLLRDSVFLFSEKLQRKIRTVLSINRKCYKNNE